MEESSFLDRASLVVAIVNGGSKLWTIVLDLYSSQREFKIATGADVTIVPEHVYNESRDESVSKPDLLLLLLTLYSDQH